MDRFVNLIFNSKVEFKAHCVCTGNNLYGEDLVTALRSMPEEEKSGYILMDRIRPPKIPNHIVRCAVWSILCV